MSEERVDHTDLLFQVANVGTGTGTREEQPDVERALVETLIAELTDGNAGVVEVDTSGGASVTPSWSVRAVYGSMGHQKRLMIMKGESVGDLRSTDLARPEELVELDYTFMDNLPDEPGNDADGIDASSHRIPGGAVRALALFARIQAVSKYPSHARSGDIVGILPMSVVPGLLSRDVGDSSILLDLEAFLGLRANPRVKGIDPSIVLFEKNTRGRPLQAHIELARCTHGRCNFNADGDPNCQARCLVYIVSIPMVSPTDHSTKRQAAPAVTVDDLDDVQKRTCGQDDGVYRNWKKNMQTKYTACVRSTLPESVQSVLPTRLADLALLALREGLGVPLVCGCVAVAGLFLRCGDEGGATTATASSTSMPSHLPAHLPSPTHSPTSPTHSPTSHPPSTAPSTHSATPSTTTTETTTPHAFHGVIRSQQSKRPLTALSNAFAVAINEPTLEGARGTTAAKHVLATVVAPQVELLKQRVDQVCDGLMERIHLGTRFDGAGPGLVAGSGGLGSSLGSDTGGLLQLSPALLDAVECVRSSLLNTHDSRLHPTERHLLNVARRRVAGSSVSGDAAVASELDDIYDSLVARGHVVVFSGRSPASKPDQRHVRILKELYANVPVLGRDPDAAAAAIAQRVELQRTIREHRATPFFFGFQLVSGRVVLETMVASGVEFGILVDATHGTTQDGYYLITVAIVDAERSLVPIAAAISEKQQKADVTRVVEIALCGVSILPRFVLADMDLAIEAAMTKVVANAARRDCIFHVYRVFSGNFPGTGASELIRALSNVDHPIAFYALFSAIVSSLGDTELAEEALSVALAHVSDEEPTTATAAFDRMLSARRSKLPDPDPATSVREGVQEMGVVEEVAEVAGEDDNDNDDDDNDLAQALGQIDLGLAAVAEETMAAEDGLVVDLDGLDELGDSDDDDEDAGEDPAVVATASLDPKEDVGGGGEQSSVIRSTHVILPRLQQGGVEGAREGVEDGREMAHIVRAASVRAIYTLIGMRESLGVDVPTLEARLSQHVVTPVHEGGKERFVVRDYDLATAASDLSIVLEARMAGLVEERREKLLSYYVRYVQKKERWVALFQTGFPLSRADSPLESHHRQLKSGYGIGKAVRRVDRVLKRLIQVHSALHAAHNHRTHYGLLRSRRMIFTFGSDAAKAFIAIVHKGQGLLGLGKGSTVGRLLGPLQELPRRRQPQGVVADAWASPIIAALVCVGASYRHILLVAQALSTAIRFSSLYSVEHTSEGGTADGARFCVRLTDSAHRADYSGSVYCVVFAVGAPVCGCGHFTRRGTLCKHACLALLHVLAYPANGDEEVVEAVVEGEEGMEDAARAASRSVSFGAHVRLMMETLKPYTSNHELLANVQLLVNCPRGDLSLSGSRGRSLGDGEGLRRVSDTLDLALGPNYVKSRRLNTAAPAQDSDDDVDDGQSGPAIAASSAGSASGGSGIMQFRLDDEVVGGNIEKVLRAVKEAKAAGTDPIAAVRAINERAPNRMVELYQTLQKIEAQSAAAVRICEKSIAFPNTSPESKASHCASVCATVPLPQTPNPRKRKAEYLQTTTTEAKDSGARKKQHLLPLPPGHHRKRNNRGRFTKKSERR